MTSIRRPLALAFSLSLTACSPADDASPEEVAHNGADLEADVEASCEGMEDHHLACLGEVEQPPPPGAVETCPVLAAAVHDLGDACSDAHVTFFDCLAARPCDDYVHDDQTTECDEDYAAIWAACEGASYCRLYSAFAHSTEHITVTREHCIDGVDQIVDCAVEDGIASCSCTYDGEDRGSFATDVDPGDEAFADEIEASCDFPG
jgi:hypothetical protein